MKANEITQDGFYWHWINNTWVVVEVGTLAFGSLSQMQMAFTAEYNWYPVADETGDFIGPIVPPGEAP